MSAAATAAATAAAAAATSTSLATAVRPALRALSAEQCAFYHEHGYLRIPGVFTETEMAALDRDLMTLIGSWAGSSPGWSGPWRKVYMDEKTEKQSKLIAMHDLQHYSRAWNDAVNNPGLCDAMADLIGENVELHHTTLHAKPPETGHPFPMHQDWAFYKHENDRYVDVLVHLDDTSPENGEIRFLDGSHKLGSLEHVTMTPDGPCTPHLPTDQFHLEDTVPVPAKRGDVVVFNINTIHGSYINRTDTIRRLVRMGYRDPENKQSEGQSIERLGPMVRGMRPNVTVSRAKYVEE
ncbi:MAG: phytanoyl-CoA dioxygenase family protein [Planctomycetes bacterium]|nr:phytanoyl-CoA dioxygenase family protein [Planctomycetota bacterium]